MNKHTNKLSSHQIFEIEPPHFENIWFSFSDRLSYGLQPHILTSIHFGCRFIWYGLKILVPQRDFSI